MLRAMSLTLVLAVGVSWADDKKDDKPAIDKKTEDLVKKVGALYKDAKSFHTDATIDTTITADDKDKREIKIKATFDGQRPNRFAMRSKHVNDDNAGLEVVSDGKMLFVHGKRLKQYTEGKAPSELTGIGRSIMQYGHMATGMLFQNLLAEDPGELLLDGVTEGKHAGVEKVGGKEAHHLKFKQDNFDWELWVAAEGQPLVLKASSTHPTQDGGKAVTVETYTNWKINGEPAGEAFAFKPPEASKKVKILGRQTGDDDKKDGQTDK